MEYHCDILIVGAGAAGLMAAYRLSGTPQKIIVLEARDRIGGRIHTVRQQGFKEPVEHGAEFVHGPLPMTLLLLDKAGLARETVKGVSWTASHGRLHQEDPVGDDWLLLLRKLDKLETDCSIRTFLEREFGDEKYRPLRDWVIRFAEGYDAADADRASAIALREEWKKEEEEQYRITGGYGPLLQYLRQECEAAGATFQLQQRVTEIHWSPGSVRVQTDAGDTYYASKVILTIPIGLWQQGAGPKLVPEPAAHLGALQQFGYGTVIKFLLQFREPFWQEVGKHKGVDLDRLGFLFSDEAVPTWWTQYPAPTPLLTGWLAGPKAAARKDEDRDTLLAAALQSLSRIFELPADALQDQLTAWEVINWATDPLSLGAYAYTTVETPTARQLLEAPVADTLYFAGEALYEGPAMGTVEAALQSGHAAAWKIAGSGIRI